MINQEIKEQILSIRASGICNMLSIHEVQRAAFERDFYELVCFIEEEPQKYVKFIIYGKEE